MQNNTQNTSKKFTIIKKIAKHGNQAVIIIPRMLEKHLKPGMITQLTIDVLESSKETKMVEGE